jgi:signal transduction histidine kinase/CheY-like chemotaxis protein
MKLQHKAWALILIVVAIGTASAMLGTRYVVGQSFDRLERERADREGERARRVLNQQHQALAASARDYAYWIDTVQFVAGTQPSFLTDNFDAENLGYLRISEVLVFDAKGSTHAALARDGDEALSEVDPSRLAELRPLALSVLAAGDAKQVIQTLRVADGQLELVVGAAIHDPDDTRAEIHGVVMMVRRFDARELSGLSEVLMTPTRLSFSEAGHAKEDTHVVSVDEARDELHAVLRDHLGQPVAALVLTMDRQLHRKAQELTWQGMGLAGLAGLLGSALLVWLLDRLILQRLQRLHGDVQRITEQGPLVAAAVAPEGNDELSRLGEGINQLLTRVRDDAAAQQAARDRQEALQLQLMQSQKTEALGRFTSGIAHDFNNSLAAIGGWVRLADEDLDPKHASHEAMQQALKATRYASGLMQQLLSFSRQSPPRLECLEVRGLIEESRTLVTSGLLRHCDLAVVQPPQPMWVAADLTQMQQVLVNLIMNAVDAMGGQGKVEILVERVTLPCDSAAVQLGGAHALPAGAYIRLTVKDHGPGISDEHRSRVFDPFFTTKVVGKGTGLGLSVAHGIMGRHGGAIGLSSAPGQGASFHLYLPEASPPKEDVPPLAPEPAPTARHLLFADDDQSVRQVWATLLARQGWAVTTARDGEEAWDLFQRGTPRFDLVLTDLSMPRLDGAELAKRIRATPLPPPIVLMSGNVSVEDAEFLMRTDFVAVLHKPVEADNLNQALQAALEAASAKPATAARTPRPAATQTG